MMPYIKLDDGYFRNPKIMQVGRDAKFLYIAGLCYAGSSLTDGFIPVTAPKSLAVDADIASPGKAIEQLVRAGLWITVEGGYSIHDYLDYNSSAQHVHAKRDAARERMQRARSQSVRANKTRSSREVREPETETETETEKTLSDESESAEAPNDPSTNPKTIRPVPKPRPTRLPDSFEVTSEMLDWAAKSGLTVVMVDHETEKFRDYWRGNGKAHVDWQAVWRNWIRRSAENTPARASPGTVRRLTTADRNQESFAEAREAMFGSGDDSDDVIETTGVVTQERRAG